MPALALVKHGTLSPARRQLAEHLAHVAALKAEADRLAQPASRLRDQLERAEQQVAAAHAELKAAEAEHATAIADAARAADGDTIALPKAPAREKLRGHVEAAERTKIAVEAALRECESPHNEAARSLQAAQAGTEHHMRAVMAEEFDSLLAERERARLAFIKADAALLGAIEMAGERGRGRFGEPLRDPLWAKAATDMQERWNTSLAAISTANETTIAAGRWLEFLKRLKTDAGAAS